MEEKKSKVGILSGTFDPVHDGHIALADNAAHQLGLEKVIVLVEPKPRHKQRTTKYAHRLAMTKIATGSQKFISVHEASAGDQHSVEHTLKYLHSRFPDSELIMIMGGDVFEYLPKWDGQDELKQLTFAVGLRTEDDGELAVSIAAENGYKLKLIQTELPRISSSHIRDLIKSGEKPGHLSPKVFEYIKKHNLYDGS